jgi:hypothetical protein
MKKTRLKMAYSMTLCTCFTKAFCTCGISYGFTVYQYCIHKVPVVVRDNRRKSHKTYAPPIPVTWLQPLHKQTNTGTCSTPTVEICLFTHVPIRAFSRLVTSATTLPEFEAGCFVALHLLNTLKCNVIYSHKTTRLSLNRIFTELMNIQNIT